jgi:DNA polymerase III subunit delta
MSTTTDLKMVYLIISEQEFLLQHALDKLKERVASVADIDFNYEVFEGDTADADAIVGACNTLPFASERRLVVVRSVDRLSKEGLDALAAYVEDPSPTTVLALAAAKLAKNTRLFKLVDKTGGVVERKTPKGLEFQRKVISMAAEQGKQLDSDAAQALVTATGENLRTVSGELQKLVSFVGTRELITRADVDQVCSDTAKLKVWEFTDALADRDCGTALRIAANLLGAGESVFALHAMGLRTVRDLIAARSLLDRGQGSATDLGRALGKPDWMVKRLPRQARAFSAEELVALLRAAAQSEANMKTSRDARLALELWIVKVCGT